MCVLIVSLLVTAVFAIDRIKTDQITSLTVVDQSGDTVISGTEFELYRVAAISERAEFTVESAFADAGVSLSTDTDTESWSARAVTLEAYLVDKAAAGAAIAPVATGTTDADGKLTFNNLQTGLYLLVGKQTTIGETIYTPVATLVTLPYLEEDDTWNYDPIIYVKNTSETVTPEPIDLTVIKVWKDDGYTTNRPNEVTVTLFQDGKEYETVTLSAANNWRYTWKSLDAASRWQVSEKNVPTNYTVTVVQNGTIFTVTNTYHASGETPPTTDNPTLPQTGQLWWPLPLLAIAGLLLFGIGWSIRRKGHERHEST
jgi:LPXTG-motif cell wall-anchored protein